ncbi:MAG: RraA family protein [Rhodobacter sp.]|uniref:RraA family protein n=1 Tax=Pararhodobacter sp. TaxID=2127056 RepID=UPI001D416171|nr:RraA family protein [Pararhodobacter sp.]MCB1344029.1 RraA family protein [Paracoccaceae bacterium]MCC0074914.1 RraA family protein [Rhodobacter sp.]HPD91382.1 RraA family protein [Pararhodobacter sp.]
MDAAVARAAALDTATLSDALDKLAILGQCYRVSPRDPGFRMTGRAFTVLYAPAAKPAGTVGDYIDRVQPGEVVVLDNAGRDDCTVWGDILTELASIKGIAGTVIDGICRDSAVCVDLGYPVFSRGAWMRTGKDRVQVEAEQVPVTVGGARVAPGDILRGDRDGVVVIPRAHEEAVLAAAEAIARAEEGIRDAVRAGQSITEARAAFGYHRLQSVEGRD